MIYRRKLFLAILEKWGGRLPKTDFQKVLFLFTAAQQQPLYDFVPYSYGCFSFQSYADKRSLAKQGFMSDNDGYWTLAGQGAFAGELTQEDAAILEQTYELVGGMRGDALIRFVYLNYPYYAIRSDILERVLSKPERSQVLAHKTSTSGSHLFTIGYQGRSLDQYLRMLIDNDVKVLIDVRKNAFSMKYGFSKKTLGNAVRNIGMEYLHIPELGIDSEERKDLQTQADYRRLFAKYRRATLPQEQAAIEQVIAALATHQRAALTCFEADKEFCHRHTLAGWMQGLPAWNYEVTEL